MISASLAPLFVFIAAMGWACDAPLRVYLQHAGWSSDRIVLLEHLFALPIVLPILWKHRRNLTTLSKLQWLAIGFIGIAGSALATLALTQSFHYLNPSVAILLLKLQPLISIGLAALLLKERLSKSFWLWAGLAICGAYLISFPTMLPDFSLVSHDSHYFLGIGLVLGAVFIWGACTVLGKYMLRNLDFSFVTSLRFAIAFLFLLTLSASPYSSTWQAHLSLSTFLVLITMVLTSGVLALFLYYRGLKQTSASMAALAELGYPFAAVFINWIFIPGTRLSIIQVLGMLLLCGAIFFMAKSRKAS